MNKPKKKGSERTIQQEEKYNIYMEGVKQEKKVEVSRHSRFKKEVGINNIFN